MPQTNFEKKYHCIEYKTPQIIEGSLNENNS